METKTVMMLLIITGFVLAHLGMRSNEKRPANAGGGGLLVAIIGFLMAFTGGGYFAWRVTVLAWGAM